MSQADGRLRSAEINKSLATILLTTRPNEVFHLAMFTLSL